MSDAEPLAAGEDEVVLDLVGGSERNGVDKDVKLAVGVLQRGEEAINLGVAGEISLVRLRVGQ